MFQEDWREMSQLVESDKLWHSYTLWQAQNTLRIALWDFFLSMDIQCIFLSSSCFVCLFFMVWLLKQMIKGN